MQQHDDIGCAGDFVKNREIELRELWEEEENNSYSESQVTGARRTG
jgi:hypothetical protein